MARRGLVRFLLHQAELFYKHQTDTKMDAFDNIFRMDPEAHLLIVRDGIDIVLYLSGTIPRHFFIKPNDKKGTVLLVVLLPLLGTFLNVFR